MRRDQGRLIIEIGKYIHILSVSFSRFDFKKYVHFYCVLIIMTCLYKRIHSSANITSAGVQVEADIA